MNQHDMTEQAYKNGYEKGYEDGFKECYVGESRGAKHGRCEYCNDGYSFIGAKLLLGNDGAWHEINNCPNCGAKMDGERREGE